MHLGIDCYPCILGQVAKLAAGASDDSAEQRRLLKKLLSIVSGSDDETSPPELAGLFHREVAAVSGISDPYVREKRSATELAVRLMPELRRLRDGSGDPFEAAVRLAIGGNVIDYGVDPDFDLGRAEKEIMDVFALPVDREALERLRRATEKAERIFYLLDNCGEAVLDRLLIDFFPDKIVLGVRGYPILNDVTRSELDISGLSGFEVYDTGDNSPGVIMRRTDRTFLEAMSSCDLVIAKGQGNFESMDEYRRPIFHLLRVKCPVVSSVLSSPLGSLQIIGRNLF